MLYPPSISTENVKEVMDDFRRYLKVNEAAAAKLCRTPLFKEIGITEELFLDGIAAAKAFSKLYEDFWKKEVCITCDDEILTKEEKCEA